MSEKDPNPKLQSMIHNPLAFEVAGLFKEYNDRLTISEIAEKLGKREPSIHRVLQRYIKAGLVDKRSEGRFTYYYMDSDKRVFLKDMMERQQMIQRRLRNYVRHYYAPRFTIVSLVSKIGFLLNERLNSEAKGDTGLHRYHIVEEGQIHGKSYEHKFDLLIEDLDNNKMTAIEIINASVRAKDHLLQLIGTLSDIPKNSLDMIFVVSAGRLLHADNYYLRDMQTKNDLPTIKLLSIENLLHHIDLDQLKNEVAYPIIQSVLN